MSVENELVKFTAQVEMDEKTAAAVQKSFADTNARCQELRDSIAATNAEMLRMRMEGKEDTEQFRALESTLRSQTKELKAASGQADLYAKKLGTGAMSVKQLQAQAKQLRTALNSMHKEADPKTWDRYQKELKETEARLRELKGGSEKTGSVMKGLGSKIAGGFAAGTIAVKGLHAAMELGKKVWEDMKTQTQAFGDQWAITMAGAKAGWQQFIANISTGNDVIKGSVAAAVKAGREAAAMMDEQFERQNSLAIEEQKAATFIAQQNAIAMDSSKPAKERKAALDEVMKKEEELAKFRRDIAGQELDAAKLLLQQRTHLNDTALKAVVDEYEKNRDIITQANDYNALLDKRASLQKSIRRLSAMDENGSQATTIDSMERQVSELNIQIASTSQNIVEMAGNVRQYNLGNDELVKAYVDGVKKVEQADTALATAQQGQARRRGQLSNQITREAVQASEQAYADETAAAERAYAKQLLAYKQQLAAMEISQEAYETKSQAAQLACINAKIAINRKYGKETIDLENQIADHQIALQKKIQASLEDDGFVQWMAEQTKSSADAFEELCEQMEEELEAELAEIDDYFGYLGEKARFGATGTKAKISLVTESRDIELGELEDMHNLMLISEEEYLARRKDINRQAAQEIGNIAIEGAVKAKESFDMYADQAAAMVSALREAETANLEAQMQAELAAAGDNAEARAAIEEQYEQRKLDTSKKYADIEMGINIAKTIADGALAVMKCFADLGPIAGGIMAALIGATTIAQVATIVAQRNAIKNQTVASSGASSAAPAGGNAVGFSEGGYTGNGGRLEVAGVVHRGEYVVPQPEMRDPEVAAMVGSIEAKRRSRTSKNSLPGFAEGGYTGDADTAADSSNGILTDILSVVRSIAANPVQAYVVLSQLEAQQARQSRFQSITQLRQP